MNSAIPVFLGVAFIVAGVLVRIITSRKDMRCKVEVEGRIVDIIRKSDHRGRDVGDVGYVSYYPVVAYEYDGMSYRKESSYGHGRSPYSIGDIVKVFVNPTDGDEFMLEGDMKFIGIVCRVFVIIGAVLLCLVGLFH